MPPQSTQTRQILPTNCSPLRIHRDTEVARGEFRKRRLDDPLKDYKVEYPTSKSAADVVVDALDTVLSKPADRTLLAAIVGNKINYSALRSIAASPISSDDLDTLLRRKLNKTALKNSQELADALAELLESCLDPERFPWIAENRTATQSELHAAKLATAVLTAVSAVQTGRRGQERKSLEGAVENILTEANCVKVTKPRGGITGITNFPNPGEFMSTCKLGGHNADLVVRLSDSRLLAIECKASNSEVNGYKRLNKEVVVDAKDWSRRFGEDVVVTAAALRGVFKASNVAEAQREGVYLFWWHRLHALAEFLAKMPATMPRA
jgi:hypothetical protein